MIGKRKASIWMLVSGVCGFSFFIIANFTDLLSGSSVTAGCLQIASNTFVCITWRRGYLVHTGFKKYFALVGTIWPIGMATITICRVILPAILQAIR